MFRFSAFVSFLVFGFSQEFSFRCIPSQHRSNIIGDLNSAGGIQMWSTGRLVSLPKTFGTNQQETSRSWSPLNPRGADDRVVMVVCKDLSHLWLRVIHPFSKPCPPSTEQKPNSHGASGFNALGLIKILEMNGVLLLSTFSLNFSCGRWMFLAWRRRKVSGLRSPPCTEGKPDEEEKIHRHGFACTSTTLWFDPGQFSSPTPKRATCSSLFLQDYKKQRQTWHLGKAIMTPL